MEREEGAADEAAKDSDVIITPPADPPEAPPPVATAQPGRRSARTRRKGKTYDGTQRRIHGR
jgi:hypothetical protein